MEYLGIWVTVNVIWQINKKVESIVKITSLVRWEQVREFTGLLNYCRDMRARRSYLLHPLTEVPSNEVNSKFTNVEQKEFDDIKCAVTHDILLPWPDFNKRFDIHAYARDY